MPLSSRPTSGISVRAARARLADYEAPADQRDVELTEPLSTRVLEPMAVFIAGLARAALPNEYVEKIQKKLVVAGRGQPEEADRFLVFHVLSVAAVPISGTSQGSTHRSAVSI